MNLQGAVISGVGQVINPADRVPPNTEQARVLASAVMALANPPEPQLALPDLADPELYFPNGKLNVVAAIDKFGPEKNFAAIASVLTICGFKARADQVESVDRIGDDTLICLSNGPMLVFERARGWFKYYASPKALGLELHRRAKEQEASRQALLAAQAKRDRKAARKAEDRAKSLAGQR